MNSINHGQELQSLQRSRRELLKRAPDRGSWFRLLVPRRLEFEGALAEAAGEPIDSGCLQKGVEVLIGSRGVGGGDLELLSKIGAALTGLARHSWRNLAVPPVSSNHQPLAPAVIPRALQRFLEWVQSEAFKEMHPVAQMSVVQARLVEIMPFAAFSLNSSSLFSACWALEADHPLPAPHPNQVPEFLDAISEAFQLSTGRLNRFNFKACRDAYQLLLESV